MGFISLKDFRFSGLSSLNTSMFIVWTAQYCCQNKKGKAEAPSWLSHHPPLWREVPFCLPAVLNRGRGYKPLVTPVWLFTHQNPSSAVFDGSSSQLILMKTTSLWSRWRLRRWKVPSAPHITLLVALFQIPGAGRSSNLYPSASTKSMLIG